MKFKCVLKSSRMKVLKGLMGAEKGENLCCGLLPSSKRRLTDNFVEVIRPLPIFLSYR